LIIRCIAIDDEPLALGKVASYISRTPFLELAGALRSGYEANIILSKTRVDLMFVDIDMPDINGLEFVRSLQNKPKIIFTTAFSEYAIDGFKLDALDYLLKPIGYNEFLKAANKARNYFEPAVPDHKKEAALKEFLIVRSDYKMARIPVNDIVYIEGMREYVRIHLYTGKPLMPLMSLRILEEQLPADRFMRVHRSFIVSLAKIISIEHNKIILEGKVCIPVSEQYKESFQKFLSSHLLG
jgi:DNA-binding LytR/AlgR family response regulator